MKLSKSKSCKRARARSCSKENFREPFGLPCILAKAPFVVRSLSAKYRPDRYRRDKSVKFGTELP